MKGKMTHPEALRCALALSVGIGFLLLILLTAPTTTGGAVQAAQSPDVPDPFAVDAQSYASDFGVTFQEAVRRLRLQAEIGVLDRQLTEGEQDTFAGLWIQHEPKFAVVVKFTKGGEGTIWPYVAGSDLESIVDVGTAPFTLQSLRDAQIDALETVRLVEANFESGISVYDNKVKIYTLDKEELESELEKAGLVLSDKVDLINVASLSTDAADIYGGLSLSTCTSGFSVENSSGTKGITTAAHCRDEQYYNGTLLPWRDASYGGSADVQWHTAPGFTVENRIKIGLNTRNITGTVERDDQPIAAYVCKYGMTTRYGCGRIADKSYTPSGSCPGAGCHWNSTFIRVEASTGQNLSKGGDSGGPFFSGTQAWGTMMRQLVVSGSSGWIRTDAVYMAVDYIGLMDVDVLTN